jgi:hypothetical protein
MVSVVMLAPFTAGEPMPKQAVRLPELLEVLRDQTILPL